MNAKKGAGKWAGHAKKAKGDGLTATQEKLAGWAKKHDKDPGSELAVDDLRLAGFDPEYPPA